MIRKFLLLLVLSLSYSLSFAQSYPYQQKWEEIEKKEVEGLLKSLKADVDEIYQHAQQDKLPQQRIKALFYQAKIQLATEDSLRQEGTLLARFKKEITQTDGVARSILQSLTAALLQEYEGANRYQIRRRTDVEKTADTVDFLTWTSNTFDRAVDSLYQASLEPTNLLQQAAVEDWLFLIDTVKQYRELRPTMYDILAHRAIDYYITKQDKQTEAGKLLQQLIQQHKQEDNRNAYLYNSLLYLTRITQFDDLSERIDSLKQLIAASPGAHYNAELLWQIEQDYQQLLISLPKEDWVKKKQYADSMLSLCRQAEKQYPETPGAKYLQQIKANLLKPEFELQTEEVILPEQAIPVHLFHKNTNKLYVKVLVCNSTPKGYLSKQLPPFGDMKQKDVDSLIHAYEQIDSYAIDLKTFDDYQLHNTIVPFHPLEGGEYLIVVANNPGFQLDTRNAVLFKKLKVSRNATLFRDQELLLTDRESGQPLRNKAIIFYTEASNNQDLQFFERVVTDANGQATLQKKLGDQKTPYYNFYYQIEGDKVFFHMNGYYRRLQPENDEDNEPETHIQFFTDRAIYRPGQTVYFKGIVYEEINGHRKVLNKHKTNVSVYDPNDDELTSMELTSNDYGSVFGSFVLPVGKLTGRYYLEEDEADETKEFSVEEYKRPTFEVTMDTLSGTPKIGDTVRAGGKAVAYSGAPIVQGKVNYRVVRTVMHPYRPWSAARKYYPNETKEIKTGETLTDADGNFMIDFPAEPAEERKVGIFRFYNYQIEVSVNDVNGETHEGRQTIAVGDKSILLQLQLADKVDLEQLDSIAIKTDDLNGKAVKAKGNIKLIKLKGPQRVLRPSLFQETDYMQLDSLSFIKLFPHLPYGQEQEAEHWPKQFTAFDKEFDSGNTKAIALDAGAFEEGRYLLEAYVLDGQDTLRITKQVQFYRANAKHPDPSTFLNVTTNKSAYENGEEAELIFSSAIPKARVLVTVELGGKIVKEEVITLDNNVKKLKFPVDENTRENHFFVHYYLGRYNDRENGILDIPLIQKQKDLALSISTFRDKLQPGQEESWELKIEGADKDRVSAELLAAMYDASLNTFAENSFYLPAASIYSVSRIARWNENGTFGTSFGNSIQLPVPYQPILGFRYEDLERFGFSFVKDTWLPRAYVSKLSKHEGVRVESAGVMDFNAAGGDFDTEQSLDEVVVVGYGQPVNRGLTGAAPGIQVRGTNSLPIGDVLYIVDGEIRDDIKALNPDEIVSIQVLKGAEATALYGARAANGVIVVTTKNGATESALQEVKARTNLKETAFFYPDLHTDEEGNVHIRFTTPESLTEWKFMAFAHTADLKTGYLEKTVRTSKDFMVVPNAPRFLRAGDELIMSTKLVNQADSTLNGSVKLLLFDAYTMQPLDTAFALTGSTQAFTLLKGENKQVSWRLKIPALQQAIVYRVVATAGRFSDGEEAPLPILPSRMLVTETLPFYANEGQTKTFTLTALQHASSKAQHQLLTFELTSNPVWYAVQALPYLEEYPYECSEQLFARLYATLVSKKLLDTFPQVKTLFDEWNQKGVLQSKLETNPELKAVLLEETPWLREAENEEEQMKRLALLFDWNNLRNQWQGTYQQFAARQLPSGAFPWFEGGQASPAITSHIVAGFGQLRRLQVNHSELSDSTYLQVQQRAVAYLDKEIEKEFNKKIAIESALNYDLVYYLYARSFLLDQYPLKDSVKRKVEMSLEKSGSQFAAFNLQELAMRSILCSRFGKKELANKIVNTLKEHAIINEEQGMYWKENQSGWNWWQSPVETQVTLIEAFEEVKDTVNMERMKLWLVRNKQSNHWASTKATTEAIYALLFTGKNWFGVDSGVRVKVGEEAVSLPEATVASGFLKKSWQPADIKPAMGQVTIRKTGAGPAWGALYWQRFEKLEDIKAAATGIQLEKTLYVKQLTANGPLLTAIDEQRPIKIGDLVTVRLVLRADRDLSFVQLKDMRASGFEPVNVLSGYKWQDGLGYYESTRDAATNFFIDKLRKGTYVFEYDVRANNAGIFNNGVSTLQSMYAPEMSARSEGIVVQIKEN